jgi:salicylate hydroxylase
VRRGELLNIVAIVEAPGRDASHDWDQGGVAAELVRAMGEIDVELRALVEAIPAWRFWSLHGRPPVAGAHAMARGRIALVGDAAHPMLPYLAQGAGMAIEDAEAIGKVLADASPDTVAPAFERYAQSRWRRCAQVQSGAWRNARIFHASGPMRWGRDAAMKLLGERLLDQPWLYG